MARQTAAGCRGAVARRLEGLPVRRHVGEGRLYVLQPGAVAARRRGRRQRRRRRYRIGMNGGRQPAGAFEGLAGLLQCGRFVVDVDDPAVRGYGRAFAELEAIIELLAQEHEQVGLGQRLDESAEAWVVGPPGALHSDDRQACPVRELAKGGGAGPAHRLSGQYDRPIRRPDGIQYSVDVGLCGRSGVDRRVFHDGRLLLVRNRRLQDIEGQCDVDGPRPSGPGDTEGAGDVVSEPRGTTGSPRGLGDVSGHVGLGHLLEPAASEVGEWGVPAEQDDRRFGGHRHVQRRERVGEARPGGDEGHSRLRCQPAPRVGGVHRCRLVPEVDQVRPGVQGRVEYRHDLVAGQREDTSDAERRQGLYEQIGSAQPCLHRA